MQKMKKILAVFLVLILLCSNIMPSVVSIAIYTNEAIENQNSKTQNENLEFDAKLVSQEENSYWLICDVTSKEVFIDLAINLKKQGYLKNAVVSFASNDGNELNYKFSGNVVGSNIEKITETEVYLNKISSGTNTSIVIPIQPNENLNLENIEQTSNVTLKAEYVDENGETENIEKTINLNLGWKEEGDLKVSSNLEKLIQYDNNEILVQTKIRIEKENQVLPTKETKLEIKDILMKNILPKDVYVLPNSVDQNLLWNYIKDENKVDIENYENDNIQEYTLVCIFDGNLQEYLQKEINTISFDVVANRKIYAGKENITESIGNTYSNLETKELKGEEISLILNSNTEKIEKSEIYANQKNEEKREITLSKDICLNISRINNKEINIVDNIEFLEGEDSRVEIQTEYRKISVSKKEFEDILGSKGKIEIIKENGEKVAEIKSINNDENAKLQLIEGELEGENTRNIETNNPNEDGKQADTDEANKKEQPTENSLEGDYVVELSEGISNIIIKLTAPIKVGNLKIREEKAFKDLNCNQKQIIEAQSMVSSKYLNSSVVEARVKLSEAITKATLEVSTNKLTNVVKNENIEIKVVLNNHNRNSDLYENPIFEIVMPENVTDMEITGSNIVCPDGLEIKSVDVVNRNSRKVIRVELAGTQMDFNFADINNGTNVIINTNISLDNLKASQNTKIEMIYVNRNATNYENEIEWSIGEEKTEATLKNTNGYSFVEIDCVGPNGMLAIEKLSNYDEVGSSIYSVNGDILEGKIKAHSVAKTVKEEIIILNNTNAKATGIAILGRVPNKEAKQIDSEELLGTTINTIMKSGIVNESQDKGETTIYYSENENAGRDIIDIKNGWKEKNIDLSKVKSYLIVVRNKEVAQGETLKFSYEYEIPANIEYDNMIKGTFAVYYNSHKPEGLVQSKTIATSAELQTGTGPKLEIDFKSSVDENTVIREGQTFKYVATVKNLGSEDAHNVEVKIPIPNGMYYIENGVKNTEVRDVVETIEVLKQNESKEISIEVMVSSAQFKGPDGKTVYENDDGYYTEDYIETDLNIEDVIDEEGYIKSNYTEKDGKVFEIVQNKITLKEMVPSSIENKASVRANEIETELESNVIVIKVKKSELSVIVSKQNKNFLVKDDVIKYNLTIKNVTKENLENSKITFKVDDGLQFVECYATKRKISVIYDDGKASLEELLTGSQEQSESVLMEDYTFDKDSKTVTLNLEGIDSNYSYLFTAKFVVNKLEEETYEKETKTIFNIESENIETYTTEPIIERIIKPKVTINQTISNESEYIKEGEEFTYNIVIKNESDVTAKGVTIVDNIPKEIRVKEIKFITDGVEASSVGTNNINRVRSILANQTLEIVVFGKVKKLENEDNYKEITNTAEMVSDDFGIKRSESISFKIEADPSYVDIDDIDDNPDIPVNPDNPSTPDNPDVPVENTYQISGTAWIDENENGIREQNEKILSNVEMQLVNSKSEEIQKTVTDGNGKYTFKNVEKGTYFIIAKYDNSMYKLTEYNKSSVSDTINSDFFESNGRAITNAIVISNISVGNIDIGLAQRQKFDFKLDKYVNRITIQNSQGTKITEYNESKLAKLDIAAKYINGTKVLIEYKIVVTNEGDISGNVKKIVDYIPNNMTFNSNLNENWYTGSDGNLYNTELENEEIKPGQSKEITLILSKTMTGENTGMISNSAEIEESYNVLGLSDKDSQEGNKAQKEDDYSTADSLITVKTGEEFLMIAIIMILWSITLVVTPIISKIILQRKRRI